MFMMSFQPNMSFYGCNPFMMGCFNPRMNFYMGLAASTSGFYPPYFSYIPFNMAYQYSFSPYGNFNFQVPSSFVYMPSGLNSSFSYSDPFGTLTASSVPKQESELSASKIINNSESVLTDIRNSKLMKSVPAERKKQILSAVDEACKKYNVDPKLVISIMYCESAFNPNATSHCGAAGLMQLMPGTAKAYGATDVYDIRQNIFAGVKFISYLNNRYNGNRDLIVAAYNAGPGKVKNWVPDIKETKNHVVKVNKAYSSLA